MCSLLGQYCQNFRMNFSNILQSLSNPISKIIFPPLYLFSPMADNNRNTLPWNSSCPLLQRHSRRAMTIQWFEESLGEPLPASGSKVWVLDSWRWLAKGEELWAFWRSSQSWCWYRGNLLHMILTIYFIEKVQNKLTVIITTRKSNMFQELSI